MKTVLFTQRVEIIKDYGERRDCADQRIVDFIKGCGYLSVPAPNDAEIVESLVNYLKPIAIILTGGNSLIKYGGNAPERDATDKMLIDLAINKNIPLYGFCRGMQSVLDYFGNELEEVKGHVAVRHQVNGKIVANVNSYHNQACKKLVEGSELEILAQTDDGVIEAIKHKKLPIVCTMWHPERENPFNECDIERIKKLFK